MSGLLTCAEFRVIRDEQALKAMNTRLPQLDAQIAALSQELAPIWKAYHEASGKHEKEKAYAQMEDKDWIYWRLVSEREAIAARLAKGSKK